MTPTEFIEAYQAAETDEAREALATSAADSFSADELADILTKLGLNENDQSEEKAGETSEATPDQVAKDSPMVEETTET